MQNTGVNEIFAQNVNRIGGVMVCMLISSAVVYGFQLWSAQTKDSKICCYSPKYTALRRKKKD